MHAGLNTYPQQMLGSLDGYVTSMAEYTGHLVAFHTLPPRLSRDWDRTDGHRHRILSSASSLQITFEEKLSLCKNTISVAWFHIAGKLFNTLWINHTLAALIWEQNLILLWVVVIPTH